MRFQIDKNVAKIYLVSFAAPFITLVLQSVFWQLFKPFVWFTFYPTVFFVAWICGMRGAIISSVLSAGMVWWFFMPPVHTFEKTNLSAYFSTAIFIILGYLFGYVFEKLKQSTKEAVLAKELADGANHAKSIFLANMSHELRTPLNAILGFSRLMQNDSGLSDEQKKNLRIINSSGEYLLSLINNILDISKIESGRIIAEESVFDLYVLMHEVQSMMSVRATEKGLTFTVEQSDDLPRYVSSDGHKLHQIILNLVSNAIKFTRKGGVTIKALPIKGDSPESARLRFEVKDTGAGIPEEEQARIFLPFEQASINATKETGTGLGLAICKQYVELLGGQINVESKVGEGSVFSFELPVKVSSLPLGDDKGGSLRKAIALKSGQPTYRLLIVEDQPENRLLLKTLLEPFGFEVRQAVNGQEGVDIFLEWRPHLIWMDIRMPVMGGLEATRHIREADGGKEVKIVALTAHALEEERLEILNSGCDDFIRKPYRESEIFDALRRYLHIEFVYDESLEQEKRSEALDGYEVGISKLPADIQKELLVALENLDTSSSLKICQKIENIDKELAITLSKMINNMQFKQLLFALDKITNNGQQ